jgi:hypothetical protein
MPMMSTLAAASNQGLGAVKQLQPPQNVAVATPPANQYPFQAIAGQTVNFSYQERVNQQNDGATGRRMVVSGQSVATPRGLAGYSTSVYGNNTNNYIYNNFLPDLNGINAGMNLRYFYGNNSSPNRLGNPSQYMTITGGGPGATNFTATGTSGNTIELNITAPAASVDNVQIYRYSTATGATSKIFDYTFNGYFPSSWTDYGLAPATYYYYYILYHRTASPPSSWTAIMETSGLTQDAPTITEINYFGSTDVYVYWTNSTNPSSGFNVSLAQYVDLGSGYTYVGGSSMTADPWARSAILTLTAPYYVGGSADGYVYVTVTNNNTSTSGSGAAYNYFYT